MKTVEKLSENILDKLSIDFLRNQVLEPLHDLPGAFDVTRRSDTDCDFHDGGSFPSMFFWIYS